MKRLAGVLAAFGVLFAGGVALAHGNGPDHPAGPDTAAVRKFQKETLALRDELAAKRLDLDAEYQKAEPDRARIAALRKEIVDLEAKIQVVADRNGYRSWGRGHDHGMRYGDGGWDGDRGRGGCGCGHCW